MEEFVDFKKHSRRNYKISYVPTLDKISESENESVLASPLISPGIDKEAQ
jgi:hypothetical protein